MSKRHSKRRLTVHRCSIRGHARPLDLRSEALECRSLLSAISLLDTQFAQPALESLAAVTNATPRGYTPAQIRQAYSFNGIAFNGGTIQGDGAGQTIAIVDAYSDPNIVSDLHVFDATFGITDPPKFTIMNQNGGSALPAADAGWSEEIALDVEWAHAMAPGANIVLVEASSSSLSDLMSAVNTARNLAGVSVVSMSWGSGEFSSQRQFDQYFSTPAGHTGVTFVASAGDSGAQAVWPAVSPNVLSVGGTSLTSTVSSGGESAWSGSGGGYSRFETEPGYQSSVQSSGARTSPDVSFNANPSTGFAVYDSVSYGGRSGWFEIGGTSAGAPQWAALLAIANQGRVLTGLGTLSGAQTNLYSLSSNDFRDITSGSNGYAARAGYDLVTGRGSPIANLIVHDLVGNSTVSPAPTNGGQTTTTTPTPVQPVSTQPAPVHYRYEWVYWNHRWWIVVVVSPNAMEGDGSGQENALTSALASTHDASSESRATAVQLSTSYDASLGASANDQSAFAQTSKDGPLALASSSSAAAEGHRRGEGLAIVDATWINASIDRQFDRSQPSHRETTQSADAHTVAIDSQALADDLTSQIAAIGGREFLRAKTPAHDESQQAIAARVAQDDSQELTALDECIVDYQWLDDWIDLRALAGDSRLPGLAAGMGLLAAAMATANAELLATSEQPGPSPHRRKGTRVLSSGRCWQLEVI